MSANLALICIWLFAVGTAALGRIEDGFPFGPQEETDFVRLFEFAKAADFDLKAELEQMYSKNDVEALARVFRFALAFKTFDANARAFGHLLYNTFLNLGEQIEPEEYLKVLNAQPADVQQRVRNFLYYPMSRAPRHMWKENEEEARRHYPGLFPPGFTFGRDDPLFENISS